MPYHKHSKAVEKSSVRIRPGGTWGGDILSREAFVLQMACLLCIPHRCDQGYQGTECHPEAALPSTIMSDFENPSSWESDWQEVIGGEVVKPEQGCGVVSSGSSLYFSKVWPGLGLCHWGSDWFNMRLVHKHPQTPQVEI